MADERRPADVVEGVAPGYGATSVEVLAYECSCGFQSLKHLEMEQHLIFGHPARRDPTITCHAAPLWDHERWCIRAKGHDGDHWTPSMNGGRYWTNREDV